MSRVAARLGAATMALYRYVDTKDDLLALMVDAAYQAPPARPAREEQWRAALSRWARAHLAALRRHPWIVRVPISGPPVMPNQVAWFEQGLRALGKTGLAEGEKLSVLLLLNGFVRNEATLQADLQAAHAADSSREPAAASYGRLLAQLVDAARFPAISALLASGVFEQPDDEDVDADFEFGLERILDGVAALVRERAAPSARGRRR
jgi:AcrR family transcriptional regulator